MCHWRVSARCVCERDIAPPPLLRGSEVIAPTELGGATGDRNGGRRRGFIQANDLALKERLDSEGLHWVRVNSGLCCGLTSSVCVVAVGLDRQNMNRKGHLPNTSIQFASLMEREANRGWVSEWVDPPPSIDSSQ